MAMRAPSKLAMAAPRPFSLLHRAPVRSALVSYRRPFSQFASIAQRSSVRPLAVPQLPSQILRRGYADEPPVVKIKKKGRGFFSWVWLLTKLGVLGGAVWFGYAIYVLRRPDDQFEPDPSKKTLVILGMCGSALVGRAIGWKKNG